MNLNLAGLCSVAGLLIALAAPAGAADLSVDVAPDSGSGTQSCDPPAPDRSRVGSSTVRFSRTCFAGNVGTASGDGVRPQATSARVPTLTATTATAYRQRSKQPLSTTIS